MSRKDLLGYLETIVVICQLEDLKFLKSLPNKKSETIQKGKYKLAVKNLLAAVNHSTRMQALRKFDGSFLSEKL